MQTAWTEAELAYLAGILDGEGCFRINSSAGHARAELQVANTDPRMMQWLHEHFGGRIYNRKPATSRHKPRFDWAVRGQLADQIVHAVLPYLVIKRDRAELWLAYRATVNPPHETLKRLSPEVRMRRMAIVTQLTALNRKGVAS